MKELNLKLTVNELNLILEALGNLSYVRVYDLIGQIQHQAKEQLNGASSAVSVKSENDPGSIVKSNTELQHN